MTEKITVRQVLNDDQIDGLRHVAEVQKHATFHLHDWAVVIVVSPKGFEPTNMFELGQKFEFYSARPQALMIRASNGDQALALVVQRQYPGIPMDQLEHFMRLIMMS